MSGFAKLHVDTGPGGVCTLEMLGATSLRYAALRFAEHLGMNCESYRYFLLDVATKKPYPPEEVAGDYDGAIFVLGCGPLGAQQAPPLQGEYLA